MTIRCSPRILPILAVLAWAAGGAVVRAQTPASPEDAGAVQQDGARVVGGQTAKPGSWPWQVKIFAPHPELRGRYGGHCGGSLIAPTWILTAAHCFVSARTGRPSLVARDLRVVSGRSRVDRVIPPTGDALGVKQVIVHEEFDPKVFANDIALVELEKPANGTPVRLAGPSDSAREAAGVKATVTGFGFTKSNHGWDERWLPEDLQEVDLPLVDREVCKAAYGASSMHGNVLDERNLCAGYKEGGRDACQGDSGGPLVVPDESGHYLQVGVVSWGEGCAEPDRYGVYTRVSAFSGWIADKIARSGSVAVAGAASSPQGPLPAVAPSPAVVVAAAPAPVPDVAKPPRQAPATANPVMPRGDRALVIGIDAYPEPSLRLKGSFNDAAAMGRFLADVGAVRADEVLTLTDEAANRAGILKAIDDWLINGSQPGSRVFLSFSGHGFAVPSRDGTSGDALVPSDVEIRRDGRGAVTEVRNLVTSADLAVRLRKLRDRQVTLLIDASQAGLPKEARARTGLRQDELGYVRSLAAVIGTSTGTKAVRRDSAPPGGRAGQPAYPDNVVTWSAAGPDQWSLVDRDADPPMGVFTRRFIEGVAAARASAVAEGRVSHAELLDRLRQAFDAYCARQGEQCRLGLAPQVRASPDGLTRDVVTGVGLPAQPGPPAGAPPDDNPAGVTLDVVQGDEVAVGGKMVFKVSAKKPGYIVLLDVDAGGKLNQVFPNPLSMRTPLGQRPSANRLEPGRSVTIPDPADPYLGFDYVAGGEPGVGMVIAVLSDKPVQVLDLPNVPAAIAGQRAAYSFVTDIARSLLISNARSAAAPEAARWSFDAKFYRIK
jgi:secreted trypsin-like serine protease